MAHLVQCTGLSWDTVRSEFDLPRVRAMNQYWETYPPVHMMIAAYFGLKPKSAKTEQQDLGELFALGPMEENPSWIPQTSG